MLRQRDGGGILLQVGSARPPLLMHHFHTGQMQFVEKDAANGDDGAVASCGRASLRRAFLPGDIHTRDIPAIARAAGWRVLPEMRYLQERALQRVEQVASAADGMQE